MSFPIDSDDHEDGEKESSDDSFDNEELYWASSIVITGTYRTHAITYKTSVPTHFIQRQFKPPKVTV